MGVERRMAPAKSAHRGAAIMGSGEDVAPVKMWPGGRTVGIATCLARLTH